MECILTIMKDPTEYNQMVHLTFSKTSILTQGGQDTERCVHLSQIHWQKGVLAKNVWSLHLPLERAVLLLLYSFNKRRHPAGEHSLSRLTASRFSVSLPFPALLSFSHMVPILSFDTPLASEIYSIHVGSAAESWMKGNYDNNDGSCMWQEAYKRKVRLKPSSAASPCNAMFVHQLISSDVCLKNQLYASFSYSSSHPALKNQLINVT